MLQKALQTFARFGYRKTSMDQVARDAGISRPGLYFLFDDKAKLFREAVELCLREDIAAAERALDEPDTTLAERLLTAFDHWTGRYLGPLTEDVALVMADNPDLVGPVAVSAPRRFERLVLDAIASEYVDPATAKAVAQTLLSTSVGIKHQVTDRRAYRKRLAVAIDLLVTARR